MNVLDRQPAVEKLRAHGGKVSNQGVICPVFKAEPTLLEQPPRLDLSAMVILELDLDFGGLAGNFQKTIGRRWVIIFAGWWLREVENRQRSWLGDE